MCRKILASGVGVVLAALVASLTASAAFPGKNGKIVFGSQHAGEDEIWVMNSDGSERRNLTRHDGAKISDIDPRWSPDGRRIVFSSDRSGSGQIWVMNANGSNPTQLTNLPGRNRYPAFTADGKQIVFQSLASGNFEIYRMNSDGSGVTNVTNDPGVDWAPATSSRGKKIVFTRERGDSGHLFIWSPDAPLKQVTSTAGYDYLGAALRDADGVPPELALDRRYAGVVLAFAERRPGTSLERLRAWLAAEFLPARLEKSPIAMALLFTPKPKASWWPKAAPEVPGVGERILAACFVEEDPVECFDARFADLGAALDAGGRGRTLLVAPFAPVVPGVDPPWDEL